MRERVRREVRDAREIKMRAGDADKQACAPVVHLRVDGRAEVEVAARQVGSGGILLRRAQISQRSAIARVHALAPAACGKSIGRIM